MSEGPGRGSDALQDGAQVPSTLDRLVEQLLGGPRSLTLQDVAGRVDAGVDEVRSFWQALGLPVPAPDVPAFTDDDVRAVDAALRAGRLYEVGQDTAVSLARSIGHSADRLVTWQVEAIVEHLARRYALDDTSARLVLLDRLVTVAPLLEQALVHAWRRQVAATADRIAAEFAGAHAVAMPGELPLARAVGFADVVAFTSRTAHLDAKALADFVQGFETGARDVVTAAGGRVVKTIGDAVLFVADDVVTGAHVALGLARAFGLEARAPVRVGFVWGRVLSRFGDVFGPSVNLAARLTDVADPATVLLDEATAALLAGEPGLVLVPQPEREMAGLGRLTPVRLDARDAGPAA